MNHPASPLPDSGHVVTPITLGQLEIPGLIDFQANFSIVAEEYGDVLKTRLSGSIGSEVIPYVRDKAKNITAEDDEKMAGIYQNFFGEVRLRELGGVVVIVVVEKPVSCPVAPF